MKPVWFELYGLPGCGKTSSIYKFHARINPWQCSIKTLGEQLVAETDLVNAYTQPEKYMYFTQRSILRHYNEQLKKIQQATGNFDNPHIIIEHTPLATIHFFNIAAHHQGFFPDEGLSDLEQIENILIDQKKQLQRNYRVIKIFINNEVETSLQNLEKRNKDVYQHTSSDHKDYMKFFKPTLNLVSMLMKTSQGWGESGSVNINYTRGILFNGDLWNLCFDTNNGTNEGLDEPDSAKKITYENINQSGSFPTISH